VSDLDELRDAMRDFTAARAWEQFHDPKSLVLALTGEMGELAELFQWLPAEEATARAKEPELARRAGEELADVLLYLVRLSDVLGIDLRAAADAKLAAARGRFPAAEVRGTAPAPKGTAVPGL
jgi:NTP pyrophosphatase (non-canonical NTP hydrolase)